MGGAVLIDFMNSHAGKGLFGITGAALLLAWPPALPWVAAIVLLQWGVRHLALAFKEIEHAEQNQPGITAGAPALPAQDSQRGALVPRRSAVPARSSLD
jgi:hypothetical protein